MSVIEQFLSFDGNARKWESRQRQIALEEQFIVQIASNDDEKERRAAEPRLRGLLDSEMIDDKHLFIGRVSLVKDHPNDQGDVDAVLQMLRPSTPSIMVADILAEGASASQREGRTSLLEDAMEKHIMTLLTQGHLRTKHAASLIGDSQMAVEKKGIVLEPSQIKTWENAAEQGRMARLQTGINVIAKTVGRVIPRTQPALDRFADNSSSALSVVGPARHPWVQAALAVQDMWDMVAPGRRTQRGRDAEANASGRALTQAPLI